MTRLNKYIIFLLVIFFTTKSTAQKGVNIEGILNPSLALYLASDSANLLFPLRNIPNNINSKKMNVYRSYSTTDNRDNIDTISKLYIEKTFEYLNSEGLLIETFFHRTHIPGHTTKYQYFNEKGRISKRLFLETKDNVTDTILHTIFNYDKSGNDLDSLNYKYDDIGRLIQFKENKWSDWTKIVYDDSQRKLPYLIISSYDSTFLYYENEKLSKKIKILRTFMKEYTHTKISVEQFLYSKSGKKFEEIIYDNEHNSNCIRKKFIYNEIGQLTTIQYCYLNTDIVFSKINFEYDNKNNLIKKEKVNIPNTHPTTFLTYFYYDEKNNLIKIDNRNRTFSRYDAIRMNYDEYHEDRTIYYYSYEY